jgi:phage shock protein A
MGRSWYAAATSACKRFVNRRAKILHFAVWSASRAVPNLLVGHIHGSEEATNMALINRVSRLFTADVHAVLDRIEEPDVLLRHAIREMEEEVGRTEQRVKQLEQERARLADRQTKIQAAITELDEQVGVAFDEGAEELARKLVKRKLETVRLDKHVTERRAAAAKLLEERTAALQEQRERLDVLRQKAELIVEAPAAQAGDEFGKADFAVGDDEVEVAFLRERQKRTRS